MSTNHARSLDRSGILSIAGVLLIVGLLWAIGVVVSGQVERAQARADSPAPVQATAARCAPGQTASCASFEGVDLKPVTVVYR